MSSDQSRPSIDWAALPSGFRGRVFILLATGILFASYLGSTIWKVAALNVAKPGTMIIFTGDVMSFDFLLIGMLIFTATAGILYLLHPLAVRRRFGPARPLDSESTLGQCCVETARAAKLEDNRFLVTPDIGQQDALAFGLPGRRRICCGGGMRLVAAKNVELCRAVIAHELAHLQHGDVDLSYFSRGVARSVFWLGVATVVIYLLGLNAHLDTPLARRSLTAAWNGLTQGDVAVVAAIANFQSFLAGYGVSPLFLLANLAFFFVVIYLEYAAVLRSREHYADIYAGAVAGEGPVKTLLGSSSTGWNRLWRFLRLHPDLHSRLAVLERPWLVLQPFTAQAIASGYIAGLFIAYLTTYTTDIRPDPSGTRWIMYPLPPCCDADTVATALAQNPLFLVRTLLFPTAVLVGLVVYASLNLRLSAMTSLGIKSPAWLVGSTGLLAILFGCGLVLGEHLNPLSAWRWWHEWPAFGGMTKFAISNPIPILFLILAVGATNLLLAHFMRPVQASGRGLTLRRRLVSLPIWVVLACCSILLALLLAPYVRGGGPNWLEAKIQSYRDASTRVERILAGAFRTVREADRSPPDLGARLYRQALADFDFILANFPDSTSAAVIRGANGNPITYDRVNEQFLHAECAASPALPCLTGIAHDEALAELTAGLRPAGTPAFGLVGLGSLIAGQRALGNKAAARETSAEIFALLAAKPISGFSVALSAPALLQLAFAMSYVGEQDKGVTAFERTVQRPPSPEALLLVRILSASVAQLEPLRREIEAQSGPAKYYLLTDLARQAEDNGARDLAKALLEEAFSIAPGMPQTLYTLDVAARIGLLKEWSDRHGSIPDLSVPPMWLPLALRGRVLLGDAQGALNFALAISDLPQRALALYEIAIAQTALGQDASIARSTVALADPYLDQRGLWGNPPLALAAVDAHARIGDTTTAVLLSLRSANRAYRAMGLVRVACAMANLRHPFLFFSHRPIQL
jgi:Zn-dependent protease with chaperone function